MRDISNSGGFTCDLHELWRGLPRISRLLGLDVGSARIGVSLSDPGRTVANPLCVVRRRVWRSTYGELRSIVVDISASGVVVGYPLRLGGEAGRACQSVRAFCRNLHKDLHDEGIDLPIALWDERLTTQASEKALIKDGDISRHRRASLTDAVAASLILQSALDFMRYADD